MNKNKHNPFFNNTINSLYEVENFLKKYHTFSDALSIFKIIKHHNLQEKRNRK